MALLLGATGFNANHGFSSWLPDPQRIRTTSPTAAEPGSRYPSRAPACGGAVEGWQRAKDKQEYQARKKERELEALRHEIGNDAFDAVVALAECRQEVAIANARVAMEPDIIRWDRGIADSDQFDQELRSAYQDLINIRAEYALPTSCS